MFSAEIILPSRLPLAQRIVSPACLIMANPCKPLCFSRQANAALPTPCSQKGATETLYWQGQAILIIPSSEFWPTSSLQSRAQPPSGCTHRIPSCSPRCYKPCCPPKASATSGHTRGGKHNICYKISFRSYIQATLSPKNHVV